ncbi:PhzF family phenazine biosynthesis protein [Hamadaea flava]|uniref:PhzF family phenazine biosynthesis protein n=1 Tax=Hamadaea flava TaxID=1742688 RepID=A0ABV8LL96_9ACTN|nr:PhzF family phenazine biosynthesis protein [Hamadaea flava]MCP2324200.1 PhzF family phenazine biosynthesis protein [Hamadaea flava]
MRYHHVDVFTTQPYSGNSLAVFPDAGALRGRQMAHITRELRHFESIFLTQDGPVWSARVFDLLDELDFAGHPVIGAAGVLHALHSTADEQTWTLRLKARTVRVTTRRHEPGRYAGRLDQGSASFLGRPEVAGILSSFSLHPDDLTPGLPPEVVSTGLRYLVLPIRGEALSRARIIADLTEPLAAVGAQFAYLLDVAAMEGRHWNNDGVVEDVATGSGAGCAAAFLRRHGRIGDGEPTTLSQGRFTGRPSTMTIAAHGQGEDIESVEVGGDVVLIGEGSLRELPQ